MEAQIISKNKKSKSSKNKNYMMLSEDNYRTITMAIGNIYNSSNDKIVKNMAFDLIAYIEEEYEKSNGDKK